MVPGHFWNHPHFPAKIDLFEGVGGSQNFFFFIGILIGQLFDFSNSGKKKNKKWNIFGTHRWGSWLQGPRTQNPPLGPHWHEKKFSVTCVCRDTFKKILTVPQKSYLKLRNPRTTFWNSPFVHLRGSKIVLISPRGGGVRVPKKSIYYKKFRLQKSGKILNIFFGSTFFFEWPGWVGGQK